MSTPPTAIITAFCQVRCRGACKRPTSWLRSMPPSLKREQNIAVTDRLPLGHLDLGDHAITRRTDGALHLHRFECAQRLAETDLVTRLHGDVGNVARHGGAHP